MRKILSEKIAIKNLFVALIAPKMAKELIVLIIMPYLKRLEKNNSNPLNNLNQTLFGGFFIGL